MIDKVRTVKRALRMIGVNYTANSTNKKLIEEEAYDVFDDIIGDILANKNYKFNVKRVIPTEAPRDPKMEEAGIYIRRFYIPADYLNTVETNIVDLDIEGGFWVTRQVGGTWTPGSGADTIWVKYCFDGDHTLVPDYFARYVALKLAMELTMIFYPADLKKREALDIQARQELVSIDRTQFSNRPSKMDGQQVSRLAELRNRRK